MRLKNRSQGNQPEEINSSNQTVEDQEQLLKKVISTELSEISTTLQSLRGVIETNQNTIIHLKEEFQEMAEQKTAQQKLFDMLHSELRDYKDDFIFARMKPLITTMLFLHDSMKSFDEELELYVEPPDWLGAEVLNKKTVSTNIVHFQDQMEEMIKMCGLVEIIPEINAPVDRKNQTIMTTFPTEDVELDNHIHKVIRSGWMQDDRIFRPAEVSVWKSE